MKRMWIGICLLAVILAAGLWLWLGLGGVFGRMSVQLDQAATAASLQNWSAAEKGTQNAQALWERYRTVAAAFSDHEPLEQIDALFGELPIYRDQALFSEYAVVCVHLSRLTEAVEEALSLTWWSFL